MESGKPPRKYRENKSSFDKAAHSIYSRKDSYDQKPMFFSREDELLKNLRLWTLIQCNGNRSVTAEILGVSVRTLRYQLKRYKDLGFHVPDNSTKVRKPIPEEVLKAIDSWVKFRNII